MILILGPLCNLGPIFLDITVYIQSDHSLCAKPPIDFKTKVPLWPDQARPRQAKMELLF